MKLFNRTFLEELWDDATDLFVTVLGISVWVIILLIINAAALS